MFVLAPLKRPPIAWLWTGQVVSGIGDELRSVALVWIAVDLIGKGSAYLTALQSLTVMVFSLFVGVYADRWDQRRTMIAVDLLRAAIVFALAYAAVVDALSVELILGAMVSTAALMALYRPTVLASLSRLAEGAEMMHAVNGLMDGTRRLARILGPAIVGFLILIVPIPHFFTLNGLALVLSALIVVALGRHLKARPPPLGPARLPDSMLDELKAGFSGAFRHPIMRFAFVNMFIGSGAWGAIFMLCLPLYFQEHAKGDIGAFGLVVSAYGIGNLAANMLVGSLKMTYPGRVLLIGRLMMGSGFLAMALAPDLPLMMVAAAFSAAGGPMNDLPYLAVVRRDFGTAMVGRLYGLRTAVDSAGILAGMLLAVIALDHFGPLGTIGLNGAVYLASGLLGIRMFNR
ncbi:MAG: MFS transporter [Alphaproteobacteria bacterium]|nr:MFS transporter [Alphaproteobacteria bacterium]